MPDQEVSTVNYLRNNVLHAYALPALVANLLVALREVTPERVAEFAEGGLPFLRAELMLHHSPAEAVAESQGASSSCSSRSGSRGRARRDSAGRGPLQSRTCRARAARPFAAAPAAPQLPDDRAADAGRFRRAEARAPGGADADAHAAAVAAVRVRAAGFLRALDVCVLHRHAARDGPRPRGRRRVAAPARAHADVGALCRAAAPGGRRARHPARRGRAGAAGGPGEQKQG